MMQEVATGPSGSNPSMLTERDRVVRLCARLCGFPDVAEDLAQETLLEAWRSRDRLRNPEMRAQWVSGIARNVCRRWHRRH